jgi:hypothetical protein
LSVIHIGTLRLPSLRHSQEHYGKYIRDDGEALLRAYVSTAKATAKSTKPEPLPEPFRVNLLSIGICWRPLTGFEPADAKKTKTRKKVK